SAIAYTGGIISAIVLFGTDGPLNPSIAAPRDEQGHITDKNVIKTILQEKQKALAAASTGGFGELWKLRFTQNVKALTRRGPPPPAELLGVPSGAAATWLAQGSISGAANTTPGSISGSASVTGVTASGALTATWQSVGTSGMSVDTITSSGATVRDANGNLVG